MKQDDESNGFVARHHSLVITTRPGARRRFLPSCSCGEWAGLPMHRRSEAEDRYRRHVRAAESLQGRLARGGAVRRRPLTPLAELPPELRPSIDQEVVTDA